MKNLILITGIIGSFLGSHANASKWEGYVDGRGENINWVNVESITTDSITKKITYWMAKVYPNGSFQNVYLDLRNVDCSSIREQCVLERKIYLNNKLLDTKKELSSPCDQNPVLSPVDEIACGVSKKRTITREFKDVKSMVDTTKEIIKKYEKNGSNGIRPNIF